MKENIFWYIYFGAVTMILLFLCLWAQYEFQKMIKRINELGQRIGKGCSCEKPDEFESDGRLVM